MELVSMYFDKKNQIERLEKKIADNKKESAKHLAFLGGSVAVITLGSLGTLHFGKSLIEAIQSGNAITYGTLVLSKFQESGLGLSIISTVGGTAGAIYNGKVSIEEIQRIKKSKEKIKELESEEEENNHTRRLG
jgi:hypothetical protein